MNQFFEKIAKVVIIYSLYIITHYIAANLYQRFCVPLTWIGFITSPFSTSLPQCQALRWVVYNTGNHISTGWILLGSWVLTQFSLKYGPLDQDDKQQVHIPRKHYTKIEEDQD